MLTYILERLDDERILEVGEMYRPVGINERLESIYTTVGNIEF